MEKNLENLFSQIKNIDSEQKLADPQNEQVLKLAFIGDTIFDLFTRDYLLRKYKNKINEIHKKNTELVCAKSQARIVEKLIDINFLTEDEVSYYKHARNAHSKTKSKNSSIIEYRKATGLEALLGLLFYNDDVDRLIEILDKITEVIE